MDDCDGLCKRLGTDTAAGFLPQAVADAAQTNADQAQQQADKWGEGGLDRTLLHTIAGGLDGGLGGALGALASSEATPTINNMLLGTDKNTSPSSLAYLIAGITAAGIGYAAGGISGAGAATNQIYNNDFVDFETRKVIRAKCEKGTTNAVGLPCAAGVVDHITSYETDPIIGKTREVAYFTPYPSGYNPDETVEVSVPINDQNGVAGSVPTKIATATPASSGNPGVDALLSDPSVWPSSLDLLNLPALMAKNAVEGAGLSVLQTGYVTGSFVFQAATGAVVLTPPDIPSWMQYQNSMQKDFGSALLTGITLGLGEGASAIPSILSPVEDAGVAAEAAAGSGVKIAAKNIAEYSPVNPETLSNDVTVARQTTANAYYKSQGWDDTTIASHTSGIDFSKPVEVVTLPKGTQVVQYQIPGNPVGGYFAPVGTTAESLGVSSAGRQPVIYTTTEDISVLRSTAADTSKNLSLPESARGSGGGIQFFTNDRNAFRVLGQ